MPDWAVSVAGTYPSYLPTATRHLPAATPQTAFPPPACRTLTDVRAVLLDVHFFFAILHMSPAEAHMQQTLPHCGLFVVHCTVFVVFSVESLWVVAVSPSQASGHACPPPPRKVPKEPRVQKETKAPKEVHKLPSQWQRQFYLPQRQRPNLISLGHAHRQYPQCT